MTSKGHLTNGPIRWQSLWIISAEAEDLIAQATRKYKEEKAKFEKAEEV